MEEQSTSAEAPLEIEEQPGKPGEQQDHSSPCPSHATDSEESEPDCLTAPLSTPPTSSSSESEQEIEHDGSRSTRKNNIPWALTNTETKRFILPARGEPPGPTPYATALASNPDSAFSLFLTEEMISMIVKMTNINGPRKIKEWTAVDSTNIRAYIGLLILGGVYRSRGETTASLWDERSGRPIFRATMSLSRFLDINAALCFNDEQRKAARTGDDRLGPIRSLWDMWTYRLPLLFNPGEEVTVGSQLVPFRGQCQFLQFMPKKHRRYGIKVWVTADVATSYAWKCDVYLGNTNDTSAADQSQHVVMEMTKGLRGVTVTCDKYLTSYSLGQALLKKKMALVGMSRKNKLQLPLGLMWGKELTPCSSVFAFTKDTTAVSYIPEQGRSVVFISTRHREEGLTKGPKKKPEIMTYYNRCKGGVENLEKIIGTYSCKKKTTRWAQGLFFNMLDISAYNAFVIFVAVNPSWKKAKPFKWRLFLEELGQSLVSAEILMRQRLPRDPNAASIVREFRANTAGPDRDHGTPVDQSLLGTRRTCKLCPNRRKRTSICCFQCGRNICKMHYVVCCKSCWSNETLMQSERKRIK